jgi:hypothetical protein
MPTGYPEHIDRQIKEAFAREYKHYANKFLNPWSREWQEPTNDWTEEGLKRTAQAATAVGAAAGAGAATLSGLPVVAGGALLSRARPMLSTFSRLRGAAPRLYQSAKSMFRRPAAASPASTAAGNATQTVVNTGANVAKPAATWGQRAKGLGWSGAKVLGSGAAWAGAGHLLGGSGDTGYGGPGGSPYPNSPGMPSGYPQVMGQAPDYAPGSNYDRLSKLHQRSGRIRDLGGAMYLPTGKTPGAFR